MDAEPSAVVANGTPSYASSTEVTLSGSFSGATAVPEEAGFWYGTSAKTIGFWMDHKAYTNDSYVNYTVSVDQIEQWTGFDFFVNLPDNLENAAEAADPSWSEFTNY